MTTTRTDWAELECDGATIDAWTSYSAESDLFTAADAFTLGIGVGTSSTHQLKRNIERLKAMLKPGYEVKLWISSGGKRALQGVFIIDAPQISNDGDGGTQLTVSGRDRAMKLFSAADPKLYTAGDTLVSVARRACEPWGIEVTADHVAARDLRQARITKDKFARLQRKARSYGIPPSLMSEKIAASIDRGTITLDEFVEAASLDLTQMRANRLGIPYSGPLGLSSLQIYQLRLQDVRPQAGETRWEFLQRHAERNGLLMSMTPDGKLLFCGLHYDQGPSYRIIRRISGNTRENNVISGSWRLDTSNVYSEVNVYGRAKGKDKARSPFQGHAVTGASETSYLPFPRVLEVRDNSIRSRDDAQRRAEYELAKSKQGALVLEYVMPGHSQNGLIFTPDTVAQVEDEVTGVYGPHYLTARTFTRSNKQTPLTSLKLVPLGSIQLSKGLDTSDGETE